MDAQPEATWGTTTVADYDGDGRLDVAELVGYPSRFELLHNEGARGHYLEVRLTGHRSNRQGIGAVLTLRQSGRPDVSQLLEVTRGTVGTSWAVAHFGLDARTDVDSLTVRWPSGIMQTVTAPQVDQVLTIDEPMQ
jgi:hypothetical protein